MSRFKIYEHFKNIKNVEDVIASLGTYARGLEGLEDEVVLKYLPTVSIEELAKRIENYVLTSYETKTNQPTPILVLGRPGLGKSQIVKELAKYNIRVLDIRLAYYDVADLMTTFPIKDKTLGQIVLSKAFAKWLVDICSKNNDKYLATVVLFDELDKANPIILNVLLQLTLDRQYDELKLPENVFIVAVANFPEDNISGASINIIENKALFDRFDTYVTYSKVGDWLAYARANNFPEEVIQYIRTFPEDLYRIDKDTNVVLTTPRRWEKVARLLMLLDKKTEERYLTIYKYFLKKYKKKELAKQLVELWYRGANTDVERKILEKFSSKEPLLNNTGDGKLHDILLMQRAIEKLRVGIGNRFASFTRSVYVYFSKIEEYFNKCLQFFEECVENGKFDAKKYRQKVKSISSKSYFGINSGKPESENAFLTALLKHIEIAYRKYFKVDVDVDYLKQGGDSNLYNRYISIQIDPEFSKILLGIAALYENRVIDYEKLKVITNSIFYHLMDSINSKLLNLDKDYLLHDLKVIKKVISFILKNKVSLVDILNVKHGVSESTIYSLFGEDADEIVEELVSEEAKSSKIKQLDEITKKILSKLLEISSRDITEDKIFDYVLLKDKVIDAFVEKIDLLKGRINKKKK